MVCSTSYGLASREDQTKKIGQGPSSGRNVQIDTKLEDQRAWRGDDLLNAVYVYL